jgi:hypothetical protein
MYLPWLSILIPSVFERDPSDLLDSLNIQIGDKSIELLVLTDNRRRSTGHKRQALLDAARGQFVTHMDDDDMVSGDYVAEILKAIEFNRNADVIVFNEECTLNGENPFTVRTGIEFENQGVYKDGDLWQDITRKPWHWCCWASRLAKAAKFPDAYIDDDWFWVSQMLPKVNVQTRIDRVLRYYRQNSKTSLSQQGEPSMKG